MFGLRAIALGLMVFGLCTKANASINFSYVSLGYAWDKLSASGDDCSQDGIFLNAAIPLNEWFYVVAEHADQTSSDWCGVTKTQFGAGMHHDVSKTAVVYGEARGVFADYPWDEEAGVGVSVGVRATVVYGTEVKGFFTYESIDGNDDTILGVGINMWMDKNFSGFFDIGFGDLSKQRVQLGVRYNF